MTTEKQQGVVSAIVLVFCAGVILAVLVTGCTFRTKDNAQWRITYGGQVGLETTSSATNATGTVETDFPALEEWIREKAKPVPVQAPADAPPIAPVVAGSAPPDNT